MYCGYNLFIFNCLARCLSIQGVLKAKYVLGLQLFRSILTSRWMNLSTSPPIYYVHSNQTITQIRMLKLH